MDDLSDAETSMESAVSKLMAGDFPTIQNTPQVYSKVKESDPNAPKVSKLEQPESMLEIEIGCGDGDVESDREGKEGEDVQAGNADQHESQLASQPELDSQAATDCQTKFKPDMFVWLVRNHFYQNSSKRRFNFRFRCSGERNFIKMLLEPIFRKFSWSLKMFVISFYIVELRENFWFKK